MTRRSNEQTEKLTEGELLLHFWLWVWLPSFVKPLTLARWTVFSDIVKNGNARPWQRKLYVQKRRGPNGVSRDIVNE